MLNCCKLADVLPLLRILRREKLSDGMHNRKQTELTIRTTCPSADVLPHHGDFNLIAT